MPRHRWQEEGSPAGTRAQRVCQLHLPNHSHPPTRAADFIGSAITFSSLGQMAGILSEDGKHAAW